MCDLTLYQLFQKTLGKSMKSMKGGGIDGGTIIDIVIILVIIAGAVIFGPILYKTLNDLGNVLDAGNKVAGAGLNAAGGLVEGAGYCMGNKIPTQVCDKNTLDTAEKSYKGTGGFDICNNCEPPCLIKKINCTKYDWILGLGAAFTAASVLAGIYGNLKGGRGDSKSVNDELKKDGETSKSLFERTKQSLKDLVDKLTGKDKIDPNSKEAKAVRAEQAKRTAEEKRREADEARQRANDATSDKEQAEKAAEQAEQEAKEAEKEAQEADDEAPEDEDDEGEGGEGEGGMPEE